MKKTRSRLLSLLLTAAMILSLAPMALAAGSYLWPVPASKKVNQDYKSSHTAIDIGGSLGTDVVATKAGTVYYVYTGCVNKNALSTKKSCANAGCSPNCGTYTGSSGIQTCNWGYGNGVVIQHSDGSGYSMYAHLNSVSVKKGAAVTQGQKIGTMGSAGNSTGTHLHFELAKNMTMSGTYCKPSSFINSSTSAIAYVDTPGASVGESGASTVIGPSTTTAKVTFSQNVDTEYKQYSFATNTNAGLVTKVTKSSGLSCTQMGVYLYDTNGTLIKKHSESISQSWITPARTSPYHSWYDVNKELGVTLTPGTMYQYQFFGIFGGQEVKDNLRTFYTTGNPPPVYCDVSFVMNAEGSGVQSWQVEKGTALGSSMPDSPTYTPEGYEFIGWFTAQTGGTQVTSSTVITDSVTFYPRFEQVEVVPQEITIFYYDVFNPSSPQMTQKADVGQTYTRLHADYPGYEFVGWFTEPEGGYEIPWNTIITETTPHILYGHYRPIQEEPEPEPVPEPAPVPEPEPAPKPEPEPVSNFITLTIGQPIMYINGIPQSIDNLGTVPLIRNDSTLLPVRAVFEAMGGTVGWNGDARVVTLTMGDKSLFLAIDSIISWDNQGNFYTLLAAPTIINDRTMLPIRFLVEYFGGTVDWDNDTRTVLIYQGENH